MHLPNSSVNTLVEHSGHWKALATLVMLSLIVSQMMTTQATPDQTYADLILFIRSTGEKSGSTFVIEVTSGEERRLTPDWHYARSWSPDGSRILLSLISSNDLVAPTLVMMDASGHNQQTLTNPDEVYPQTAQWTPDGTRILFWGIDLQLDVGQARSAIYDVSVNDGSISRLTEPMQASGWLDISPDGSQIAFTDSDGILFTMPTDGGEPQRVDVPFNISVPSWSPDGSLLAGLASDPDKERWLPRIVVMEADGSNPRFLVRDIGEIGSLSWSPDGSELLFIANYATDTAALAFVNVETTTIRRYEVGEGILEPLTGIKTAIWSPDGTQIALTGFYRENNPYNSGTSLYLVDRNVRQLQRLTNSQLSDDVVQWRPQPQ